jgi:DNA-binding NtrC family response regulator
MNDYIGSETVEMPGAGAPGPWVVELGTPEGGSSVVLRAGERIVIGSGRDADVRLDDPAISHRHCALSAGVDRLEVEDLGSRNGTYVGSVRITRAEFGSDGGALVLGRSSVVVRGGLAEPPPTADPLPGLVGASLGMQRVAAEVRRHARTRAPILIHGESGTGKDVVARAVHQLSRRTGNYVPLNLSALPESLADAELFGHRRGAFTGAVQSRAGAFEVAHGGTLFLDEIADLTPAIQVKLLRVVEDGGVRPLGATSPVLVDVRIVSASWAELEQRVAEERFRADLFHRLATVVVRVPPLRQRKSDIPELCRVLLARIRPDVGDKRLTSAALSRLLSHSWPGNVRELSSALYRAAMATRGEEIGSIDLSLPAAPALPRPARIGPRDARRLLDEHQKNVSAAARAAGVPRSTFRSWLARSGSELADDEKSALAG